MKIGRNQEARRRRGVDVLSCNTLDCHKMDETVNRSYRGLEFSLHIAGWYLHFHSGEGTATSDIANALTKEGHHLLCILFMPSCPQVALAAERLCNGH